MTESPQPSSPSSQPVAVVLAEPAWSDLDYALGCECANPALQIELWMHEALAQTGLEAH